MKSALKVVYTLHVTDSGTREDMSIKQTVLRHTAEQCENQEKTKQNRVPDATQNVLTTFSGCQRLFLSSQWLVNSILKS